jgi:hypothetical protein
MVTAPPGKLAIFDYSGTLSLEAPRFARRENLLRTLRETGLAALGVSTPEVFWGEIVDPTWREGSTTSAGYKKVMTERIAAHLTPDASRAEVAAAASRFVDTYLSHSQIDPHWRPLLKRLSESPGVGVIIATDHYAEATEAIIRFLKAWGIPAIRARGADSPFPRRSAASAPAPCFVANSADFGAWKAERRYWETLQEQLSLEKIRRIILVDDFGFNEDTGNSYGARAKVVSRREKTETTLREVFRIEPEIIPFFLEAALREREDARTRLIAETALHFDRLLG